MFESLSDRLSGALKRLTCRGMLRPEDVDAALKEVRMALLEADVNYKVVKEFGERVRERMVGAEVSRSLNSTQQVVKVVHDELVELLGGNEESLHYAATPPTIVLLAGLQGSGKTTTAVKLALLARREGKKPMVVALDLRRPAAVDQLRQLAEREKLDFWTGQGAVERIAAEAVEEARTRRDDVVILDTAGRLHLDEELMEELKRLKASLPVTETLLVADSMTGQEAVNVGKAFQESIGLDGVILTKLDGDARGGAALSLRVATGQQVRFAGVGEKPQDLEVFHADRMASRILGMGDVLTLIEQAERTFEADQAERMAAKLTSGTDFTLEDFLEQLQAIRRMGPIGNLLGMLPGAGQMKEALAAVDDKDLDRTAAIIRSMTPAERADPKLINGSRRLRIANGSGVTVSEVNSLVDRFFEARKMMARMAGMGMLPGGRRNARSAAKGKKGKKGKAKSGRGPSQPRLPAGFPGGLPGGFPAGLPGGFGNAASLPPGTELPDLSKLKFPKS